ncbi:hypothetical protein C4K18_3055 [Pseudomonas chlororaphis subsp. aurantiaca]|nr:hypothetical protein C4K18_3055 [Pseudomonas chlororaphis subsp. aurantiaca]
MSRIGFLQTYKIYERVQTPQKKLPDAKGGHTGVLQYTLRLYPELEESLLAEILKSKN